MPKESKLPGKIGDICRVLGTTEACKRLGIDHRKTLYTMAHRRRPWSEDFHNRVSALHREVVKGEGA